MERRDEFVPGRSHKEVDFRSYLDAHSAIAVICHEPENYLYLHCVNIRNPLRKMQRDVQKS